MPGVFAGACRLPPWVDGVWNFSARVVRGRPGSAASRSLPGRRRAPRRDQPTSPRPAPRPAARVRARRRTQSWPRGRQPTMPTWSIRSIIVVLLLRRAARRGRWCPWDGASATFSTPGSVLSSRTCFFPSPPWGAHTAEREPARTHASRFAYRLVWPRSKQLFMFSLNSPCKATCAY
jgi:hypothetical protein